MGKATLGSIAAPARCVPHALRGFVTEVGGLDFVQTMSMLAIWVGAFTLLLKIRAHSGLAEVRLLHQLLGTMSKTASCTMLANTPCMVQT
jgi:hypothetical protein